jgi:hypothetical protein
MIINLATYKAYFATLAAALGCDFVWAHKGRVMDREAHSIAYPLLWCPVPDVRLDTDGKDRYVFTGALVLLTACAADDYAGQDAACENMLELSRTAVGEIRTGADDGLFVFDPDRVELEQVSFWTADNDHGWKVEFEITGANLC